jgi:glycosyltransferase involved in cell wall biosynthesis
MATDKKKQRHAIWYENRFGRNDGAPLYYFNVLKNDLKLDVTHLAPHGDTSQFGKFDYHWWIDWGEDALPWEEWEIPKDGGKTIYVASDTHLDNGYRVTKALDFDYVFFNQKKAVDEYKEFLTHPFPILKPGIEKQFVGWLPHAAEPKAYPNIEIIKKYDVGFVGHVQETPNYNGITRIEALDRLFKEFPNFYHGSRHPGFPDKNLFEDAARKFSLSRVVFNISIKDDINMRVFETLSTGSFLLTNWLPTLGDLFEDGEHLVTYKTLDEMVEKAKYYLEHDNEREKIAKSGYEEFISKHTYRHRIEKILEIIK